MSSPAFNADALMSLAIGVRAIFGEEWIDEQIRTGTSESLLIAGFRLLPQWNAALVQEAEIPAVQQLLRFVRLLGTISQIEYFPGGMRHLEELRKAAHAERWAAFDDGLFEAEMAIDWKLRGLSRIRTSWWQSGLVGDGEHE
jgi:hypothetical protein